MRSPKQASTAESYQKEYCHWLPQVIIVRCILTWSVDGKQVPLECTSLQIVPVVVKNGIVVEEWSVQYRI